MNDKLTYGATRSRLLANFYTPTSASNPGAHGPRIADDLCAVQLVSERASICGVADSDKRNIVVITICARDKKIRAEIVALFAKHGLGSAPVRTDSAGNDSYVLRFDGLTVFSRQSKAIGGELDPAVILTGVEGSDRKSGLLRLDGVWTKTLLDTPRSKLPELQNIDGVFGEVEALFETETAYEPPQLSPEMQEAIKRSREEREAREAKLAACNDPEILALVERRRPGQRLGDGPWNVPSPAQRDRDTIRIYAEIVGERGAAEIRKRELAKFGLIA